MSETERALLKPEEIEAGIRLSCMIDVNGTMEVELLKKGTEARSADKGIFPAFEKDHFDEGYGIVIDIGTTTVGDKRWWTFHRTGTGKRVHDQCPEALRAGCADPDHL